MNQYRVTESRMSLSGGVSSLHSMNFSPILVLSHLLMSAFSLSLFPCRIPKSRAEWANQNHSHLPGKHGKRTRRENHANRRGPSPVCAGVRRSGDVESGDAGRHEVVLAFGHLRVVGVLRWFVAEGEVDWGRSIIRGATPY